MSVSPFPTIAAAAKAPETFEEFWGQLPRDTSKFQYYRHPQINVLKDYRALGDGIRDVAVCLPTGSGKTAVALSIGGLAQLQRKRLVIYLCPTIQLCTQVLDEAKLLGVPAVPLFKPWGQVPDDAKAAYGSGTAIGVATYFTMFNSNPHIDQPEMILCDDIHAAAPTILNPWTLKVPRSEYRKLFDDMYAILKEQVPSLQLAAAGARPSPERRAEMVRARDWLMVVDSIQEILQRRITQTSELRHPWRRLNGKLAGCFCFLTPETITIRPWIAPTFELGAFASAKRRVYFSATLDRWGQIEHVTGVQRVERLSQPDVVVPGRRLILNLDRLMPGTTEVNRVVTFVAKVPKALVLCKNLRDRSEVSAALAGRADHTVLGSGILEDDLEKFKTASKAVLVLANRYDGIDLGRDVCRSLVLYKLPLAVDDQEEFTTTQWKMTRAAEARARQRVHQGLGRCTRDENDSVVVGVVGKDVNDFLLRPQVQSAMPRRIRAELALFQEMNNPEGLDPAMSACLQRDASWKALTHQLDARASGLGAEIQPDEPLMEVHRREANFAEKLWIRDFPNCSSVAQRSAQELVGLHEDASAAPWFYLAAVAEDMAGFFGSGNPFSANGARLLNEAVSRASGREWFGELSSYVNPPGVAAVHNAQLQGIVAFLRNYPPQTDRLDKEIDQCIKNLSQTKAEPYHAGLRFMGSALGFKPDAPKRDAAPDMIWSLSKEAVIIWEAKTDKEKGSPLSVKEVRQIRSLPGEVMANDGLTVPQGFRATCITHVESVAPEADGLDEFDVARPATVLEFAESWLHRVSLLHKRTSTDSPEGAALIQAALLQMRAHSSGLAAAMAFQRGSDALR